MRGTLRQCLRNESLPAIRIGLSENRPGHGQEYAWADDGRLFNEGEETVFGTTN